MASTLAVYVNNQLIGAASYGQARPDVGSYLKESRFTNSGYTLTFDSRAFPDGPATIRVGARSIRSGQWIETTRTITIANGPQPTSAVLSGRITDANGVGLSGARISLGNVALISNADGSYRTPNMPAGNYTLIITRDGYQPMQTTISLSLGEYRRNIALTASVDSGLTLPIRNPIRNQAGDIVNAYYDLDRSAGRIYDHPRPIGSKVQIGRYTYTAPWPGNIWRIGLAYNNHDGVDFNGRLNSTQVIAAAPGYVVAAYDRDPNYNRSRNGNYVVMRHPDVKGRTVYTYYWHLQPGSIPPAIKYAVNKNILIGRGAFLGLVGMSGNTTGPHLHFGVGTTLWRNGIDPYNQQLWATNALQQLSMKDATPAQVENQLPVGQFMPDASVITPGSPIQFDAGASSDPDGELIQYVWDMGDGTLLQGATVEHKYATVGTYYVSLTVVDAAGASMLTDPQAVVVTSDTAKQDTTPPQVRVATANPFANTSAAQLALTLAEDESREGMLLRTSRDGVTFSDWQPFTPTLPIALHGDEGVQMVFVQVKDAAGNVSLPVAQSLIYDTSAPILELAEPISDPNLPWEVRFTWAVEDLGEIAHNHLDAEYQLVGVDADWRNANDEHLAVYSGIAEGEYTFRVRVTDQAGNVTTDEVTVDVSLPPGSMYLPVLMR